MLNEQLSIALSDVVISIIGFLCTMLIVYVQRATVTLRQRAKNLEDKTQAELIDRALDRIDKLAERTVGKIEQETAAELRRLVKEGKVSRENLKAQADVAYTEIMNQLSADTVELVSRQINDISQYVHNAIEDEVLKLKLTKGIGD